MYALLNQFTGFTAANKKRLLHMLKPFSSHAKFPNPKRRTTFNRLLLAKRSQLQPGEILSELLHNRNLSQIAVEPDGNCLYRALSVTLWGDVQQYQRVRDILHEYLSNHQGEFSFGFDETIGYWVYGEGHNESQNQDAQIVCISDILSTLRRDREWGGNFELSVAARAFNVNIFILSDTNANDEPTPILPPNANDDTRDIYLVWDGQSHYSGTQEYND
jgi:hypothetical protein